MQDARNTRLTDSQVMALEGLQEGEGVTAVSIKTPVASYIDPAVFELEKDAIFNRAPLVAGPSAILPQVNSFQRIDLLGRPVLLTRAADGVARAFLNVCRHRGSVLCPGHEPGKGKLITCPYHAWTYGLDGRLQGVPRAEIFADFDKSDHNLTPLPCREAGGVIWVGLQPGEIDFGDVAGELAEELDGLGLGAMTVFDRRTYTANANWKLVMDTMLDSYHVLRLHKNTLAKYFLDTPVDVKKIGPHIRSLQGRGNFDRSKVSDDFETIRRIAVFSYSIFPTGIIVTSPDYINFGVLRPVAFDQTHIDYYLLARPELRGDAFDEKLRKSFELMDRAFGQEDFWAAEQCHTGLSAGAMTHVTLGGMEKQMAIFHDTVDMYLREASFGKNSL